MGLCRFGGLGNVTARIRRDPSPPGRSPPQLRPGEGHRDRQRKLRPPRRIPPRASRERGAHRPPARRSPVRSRPVSPCRVGPRLTDGSGGHGGPLHNRRAFLPLPTRRAVRSCLRRLCCRRSGWRRPARGDESTPFPTFWGDGGPTFFDRRHLRHILSSWSRMAGPRLASTINAGDRRRRDGPEPPDNAPRVRIREGIR